MTSVCQGDETEKVHRDETSRRGSLERATGDPEYGVHCKRKREKKTEK
jgi:hypothetical protein